VSELELLEMRARVHELVDEIGIDSTRLRDEMTDEPARALRVLEHARRARGIRNRASFAISRWRGGAPPARRAAETALEWKAEAARRELASSPEGPPTLEALELAWHLEELGSPIAAPVLRLLVLAVERSGGCRALLERSSFDD
jgi:hypothetical protein